MISVYILEELVAQGILLGGLYALISYGLSIALGIIREINVAHGSLLILAAYLGFAGYETLRLSPLLSLIWIVPFLFAIGWAIQKGILNKAIRVGLNDVVIVTFALSIIIENLLLAIFSYDTRSLAMPNGSLGLSLGPITVQFQLIMDFVAGIAMLILLNFIFKRTLTGKAMRALPADPLAAQLLGINPGYIYALTMGLAMSIVAVSGIFLGSTFVFMPSSGDTYILLAFGVVVLGGLGSLIGTLVGGLILGEVFVFTGYLLGASMQMTSTLIFLLIVLLALPMGLFKGEIF